MSNKKMRSEVKRIQIHAIFKITVTAAVAPQGDMSVRASMIGETINVSMKSDRINKIRQL